MPMPLSFENPFLQRRRSRPTHPYMLTAATSSASAYSSSGFSSSLYRTSSARIPHVSQSRRRQIMMMTMVAVGCLILLIALFYSGNKRTTNTTTTKGTTTASSSTTTTGPHEYQSAGTATKTTTQTTASSTPQSSSTSSKNTCLTSRHDKKKNDNNSCQRLALRAHKMGVVLLRDFLPEIPSAIIHPKELPSIDSNIDYRHVVLTRPFADAIVSGFLYHSSGRECWLDQEGNPRTVNKTFSWMPDLQVTHDLVLKNATSSMTLCEFLNTATEEFAMKVYMDWSLNGLYGGIVPYYQAVQQRKENKTLFVCFDELSHLATQAKTLQSMRQWLYPYKKSDKSFKNNTSMQKPQTGNYQGGHSTSKDPNLRIRLLNLIATLDQQVFQNRVAEATALLGCDS